MNWAGDYIQKNIDETDTILDLGCGVMQSTLNIVKSYPDTRLKCKRLVGVDIHQPYLDFLSELEIENLKWDLRDVPLPFENKSFDIILFLDVWEHLPKIENVDNLIKEAERIARKKIFYVTPSVFFENILDFPNPYPYDIFEDNKFQRHKILLDKKYLKGNGFRVLKKGKHYYGFKKVKKVGSRR